VSLVVSTGDWHGDAYLHGTSRFDEVARAVRKSVDVAIERRASLYVFGGDLCDPDSGPVVFRCVELAVECAIRLADGGIPSLWVPGNHDVLEDGSGDSVLSPLRPLCGDGGGVLCALSGYGVALSARPGVYFCDGFAVVTLPFAPTSHAYDPASHLETVAPSLVGADGDLRIRPDKRVLIVSHLSVPGIVPGEETTEMPRGREVSLPLEVLATKFPGAVVSQHHYHRRHSFRSKVRGCPSIHVAGSLARLTHGEEDYVPGINLLEV
jgi:DNA repair exonuclease SbcCD nuclease subunit